MQGLQGNRMSAILVTGSPSGQPLGTDRQLQESIRMRSVGLPPSRLRLEMDRRQCGEQLGRRQGAEGGLGLFEEEAGFGFLLFEALNHLRGSLGQKALVA